MEQLEIPGMARDPKGAEIVAVHDLIDFAGKDVLEIGCGDGRLTRRIAERTRSVLGVDVDAESIALAQARLPESLRANVTFQVTGITAAKLPAAAFDVAVLSWSI